MRDLRTLSGPWKGLWTQARVRETMSLTLRFGDGLVEGGGRDHDGAFSIRGTFSDETNAVLLMKRYTLLTVVYEGVWDDPMIHGVSAIGVGQELVDAGEFEMWPESEEEREERETFFEELVEPVAPAAPIEGRALPR